MHNPRRETFLYNLSWILFLLLLLVVFLGSYIMPHKIDSSVLTTYRWINASTYTLSEAPYPPSGEFLLGTDHRGYDLLSLLMNGGKYTLLFCSLVALARFVIGLPLGLYAGTTKRGKSAVSMLGLIFGSVPAILYVLPTMFVIYYSLRLNLGSSVNDPRNVLFTEILFAMLVIVGIFPVAQQFSERAEFLSSEQYVTAARSLGAGSGRIIFRHILPHLKPEIAFLFLAEFVQILFLIAQIALFGIFLGGTDTIEGRSGLVALSTVGEWGGMIAYGIKYVRFYPWLSLYPSLFVAATILICSFLSKQIQRRSQNPEFYRDKTWYKNKTIAASLVILTVSGIIMAAILPNKSPAADTVMKLMQPATENELKRFTDQFMGYVKKGEWKAVESYLDDFGELKELADPLGKFKEWKALFDSGYQYKGIAKITKELQSYQIEMMIQEQSGSQQTWHLEIAPTRNRVSSAN